MRQHQTAQRVLQVTSPHEATGMTLLEGPTFDGQGRLHLVDVTAPAGAPKVMRIDLDTEEITPLVTEGNGAFTSAQWGPQDGRLYLTDYASGQIISVTAEGEDARTVFSGEVEGRAMHPDDLAFDEAGNMFVSDSSPTVYPDAAPTGRVVRIDAETSAATVLADNQPNPNGISLDRDGALWISQLDANRIDRLLLNQDRIAVTTGHTAIHVDGGPSQADSNAIDADGNIYQASHGIPRILVYGPDGTHRATIDIPAEHEGLESATNLAIRPGTQKAFVTVSGPAGGFIYRFDALAEGTRQSNGG
ncbi:SMP-30/gluconolactonase/LRE family protein [Brachybacterium sacelli]|uniref:Lactonase n=1 Tax=Brachybacterium sacelli TaxID=173364 RepID=A0ABS4WVY3_9MICO|nr:SMP-30/gluconolactonase/LRE family protein [Brachybacterium sacelli]MBP2380354.1 lactonase [Brachybacterium sacelli]